MAKFQKADSTRAKEEMTDSVGKVRVQVYLMGESSERTKGNVTRTITLKDTTVTAVGDAIEKALLE